MIDDELDHEVKARLLQRAHRNGRTLEAEVLEILRDSVKNEPSPGLGMRLAARFHGIGIKEGIAELRGYPVKPIKL
jgi:plasmid stability protein